MLLIAVVWLYFMGGTYAGLLCTSCLYSRRCQWRWWGCANYCAEICCRPYKECWAIEHLHIIPRTRTSTTHKSSAVSTSLSTTGTKGINPRSKISTTFPSVASTFMTGMPGISNYKSRTTPAKSEYHKLSQMTHSIHSFTIQSTDRTSTTLAKTTKQNVDKKITMSSDPPKSTVKVGTTSAKRVDNGAEICECDISYLEKVEFWKSKNFTPKEMLNYMAPLMKTVIKELELNKTRLLINKLKRTSAPDNRRSSKQIGVTAIAFIVGVVVLVIFIDVISVLRFFNILED